MDHILSAVSPCKRFVWTNVFLWVQQRVVVSHGKEEVKCVHTYVHTLRHTVA